MHFINMCFETVSTYFNHLSHNNIPYFKSFKDHMFLYTLYSFTKTQISFQITYKCEITYDI